MNLQIKDELIPGTKLKKDEMGNVTGLEFLSKVFYISDGVMLSQIREVSGIDGSTLQNWTKRGWVANARLKKYNIDQVAHILIINMLRSYIQLDKIALLLHYINGKLDDQSDDIIRESVLYVYICRILDKLMQQDGCSMASIKSVIQDEIADYQENMPGASERLAKALEIIIIAYYAALIKHRSDDMLSELILRY
jgi:DNA-binding transcriptional MerR regulator